MSSESEILESLRKTGLPDDLIGDVSLSISAYDDMYQGNLDHYFKCGAEAAVLLKESVGSVAAQKEMRILDFPCGFGRVTRWIPAMFPQSRITASDLNEIALDFINSILPLDTFKSDEDFKKIQLESTFDLVWVGSLITHIPESKAIEMLDFILSRLEPKGIALVTFLGSEIAPRFAGHDPIYGLTEKLFDSLLKDYSSLGYGYSNYPNQNSYGISLISNEWWVGWQKDNPAYEISIAPLAWDSHHNIVTISSI